MTRVRPILLFLLAVSVSSCLGDAGPERVLDRYPLEAGWVRTYSRETSVEVLVEGGGGILRYADAARVTALGIVDRDPFGREVAAFRYERLGPGTGLEMEERFVQDSKGLQRLVAAPPSGPEAAGAGEGPVIGLPGMLRAMLAEGADRLADANTLHTLLAYPLVTGNTWVARERAPVVTRRVAGHETVVVPAGRFRAVRVVTTVHGESPLEYVDWIAAEGLVRRELDVILEDFLAPGNPAPERVRFLVELEDLVRP